MVLQYSIELPSLERDGYKAQSVGSGKELGNESIEPDVIGSYVFIPKNLTFAEVISILSKAIKENSFEELDDVIQNIEYYDGRSITLSSEDLKDFCLNQLNLDLQNGSDRYIYSNILSQYNFDQSKLEYNYPVKELVLLAIAANDKLMEKYQNVFFARENLSLLPLIVGGNNCIEAFVNKFPELYQDLKNRTIQLNNGKIDFFSTAALRKEEMLLGVMFAEDVLKDFERVLKASDNNPLYGVLETASLVENRKFITIVLGAFEKRYINEPTKDVKDLLKKSLVTLLETAISQEHASIVEYLCKKCTGSKELVIQEIYEEAFANNRVIKQLDKQIIKQIISGGTNGSRKEKAEKIYGLTLQVAAHFGNTDFIMRVLDLIEIEYRSIPNIWCKDRFKDSNSVKAFAEKNRQSIAKVNSKLFTNVDTQKLLHDSSVTILKSAQYAETVTNLYDRSWKYKANKPAIQGIYNNAFKSFVYTFANQEISKKVDKIESIVAVALLTDNKSLIKRALDLIDRDIIDTQEKQKVLLRSLVSILTHSVACECFQTIQYICYGRYSKVSDLTVKEVYQKVFSDERLMRALDNKIKGVEQGLIKHERWIELQKYLVKNVDTLTREVDTLTIALENTSRELSNLKKLNSEILKVSVERISAKEKEINKLKNQITQLTKELRGKKAQPAEEEKELQDLEKQLYELCFGEEISELALLTKGLEEERDLAVAQKLKQEESFKQAQQEINNLKEKLEREQKLHSDTVNKAHDQSRQYKAQLAEKEKALIDLGKSVQELEQVIENLNGQIVKLGKERDLILAQKLEQGDELQWTKAQLEWEERELNRVKQDLVIKTSEINGLRQSLGQILSPHNQYLSNENEELSAANAQNREQSNCASVAFVIAGIFTVGASLATPYLAIFAILAVAASVFLALGCHFLYKANTTLSNVEVDQQDNQQSLEIRP